MKSNIGLQRIDNHRSHLGKKSVSKFLQKIGFQEFQDEKLKEWLEEYRLKREKTATRTVFKERRSPSGSS